MQQRFELQTPTQLTLTKFQTRPENHGEVLVTACDLRVSWTTNNRALNMLHPELAEAFYRDKPEASDQDSFEFDVDSPGLQFLRFADLGYPLEWNREWTGYTLRVDYGLGGDSDMVLKICKIHKFKIEPMDGGSVTIDWTISSSADLTETFCGRMDMLQKKDITITLLAPNSVEGDFIDASSGSGAPGTSDGDGDSDGPDSAEGLAGNDDATSAFIDAHASGATH